MGERVGRTSAVASEMSAAVIPASYLHSAAACAPPGTQKSGCTSSCKTPWPMHVDAGSRETD